MAKKKQNDIRVRFVGTNSEDVTGSCTHVVFDKTQILLECGIYQSCGSVLNDYKVNNARLQFKPKDINYVFLMHNHIDHIGRTPQLYAQGCKAKIIAPKGSYEIARQLLLDSAYINKRNAEVLSKAKGKNYDPIYTAEDVELCLQYWCEYEVGEKIELDEVVSFQFKHSGHILNACQLELWVNKGSSVKKIGYTSDLGNISVKNDYVEDFEPISKCNLLIGECTYSDQIRTTSQKDRDKDLEKIEHIIKETCISRRGKVLIPCFANQRTQNMLTHLYNIFGKDEDFNIPVLIDSPMAVRITKVFEQLLEGEEKQRYRDILSWKNLVCLEGYEDSKRYLSSKSPVVCMSSSGFLTAGRSVSWSQRLIPNANNHVLFCGFAPQNSVAFDIKEGKKNTIRIDGKSVKNKCRVTDLKSFSSHMQHDDLLKYYSDVNCEKVALVHGNFDSKCKFAKELQDEISRKNKNSKVVIVNKNTEIIL